MRQGQGLVGVELPRPRLDEAGELRPVPGTGGEGCGAGRPWVCLSFLSLAQQEPFGFLFNSIQFTPLKCTIQWFSVYAQGCATITTI